MAAIWTVGIAVKNLERKQVIITGTRTDGEITNSYTIETTIQPARAAG